MSAFVCPHCGAKMTYDIEKAAMTCEYCRSVISREEYQEYLDKNGLYITNELTCPQCGAAILSYDDTIATFCSYCGASTAFTKRIAEDSKPDALLPFLITKEKAAALHMKKLTDSGFAPEWLKDGGTQKTVGIYIPYYVYDSVADCHVKGKGENRTTSGDYTVVREYDVDFDLHARYSGTRFDAAEAFPDCLSESVDTFDPKRAQTFQTSYLAGFYADGGNVREEAYSDVVKGLVSSDLRSSRISQNGITVKSGTINPAVSHSTKKMLFPIWLVTHRKGNRVCYSAINGQSGTVAAQIPIDKGRYIKYSVIFAAVISAMLNLSLTLKPEPFLVFSSVVLLIFGIILRKLTGDVYVREHHMDDIGRIGPRAFSISASPSPLTAGSGNTKPGKAKWNFRIPFSVRLRGWLQTLIGLSVAAVVLLSHTVFDGIYYGTAAFNIALTVWAALDLIKQQNALASRDIPIFTMARGGDENV